MASSRRTYDTDVITLRKVFAKDPGNSNVPALRTLTADGQGGTYWAIPSTLGLNPSFNEIITSAATYTADLSYNKFRLLAGENMGMVNGPPGSNQTTLFAKAFSQFDVSGENTLVAFKANQLDSSVTFAGQGGITITADPGTNTLFFVGPASNTYLVSTGIYGFNQIKVTEAASTITSNVYGWDGTFITATSPSTLLRMIGYNDIQLSTNVTSGSIFFTISTFTSKGYLDISANAYAAYPSTLSTVSSLYVQIPVFDSTIAYLSSYTGFGFSSVLSSINALAMSTGDNFYLLTGLINARATIDQLNDTYDDLMTGITSTTIGLGTLGYISTGAGATIGAEQLLSTVTGLGSAGYISTGGGGAGDVTKGNLISTVQGLGSAGYVSSLSVITTSTIFNTGAISTYSLEVFGPATLTNSGSTILRGPIYLAGPTYVAGSFTGAPNTIVTPGNLASTTIGLGTARYVSTASLVSTVRGLGATGFISSGQLTSSIQGLGTYGYLSSLNGFTVSTGNIFTSSLNLLDVYTNDVNFITISSGSLLVNGAKIEGGGGGGAVVQLLAGSGISLNPTGGTGIVTITNTGAGIGTSELISTVGGLGTAGYISTAGGGVAGFPSTISSSYGTMFQTSNLRMSTVQAVNIAPSQSNFWVAVGYGDTVPNSIQYSRDGLNWTDATTGGFSLAGKAVAYNGSVWVAVGNNGGSAGSIQYSGDGQNWSNANNGFSISGNGIAWNGSRWIAVGNNGATLTSIQTSTDGINWTGIATGGFSGTGEGIAWNGYIWVATGQGASAAQTIQYSIDGLNWTSATTGGFSASGKGVAWNGSLWVAVGDDSTQLASVQYSRDGKNWSNSVTGGFISAGTNVAWNGSLWVAVGDDNVSAKSIQYSQDGSNWSDIATGGFPNDGYGIAWNGSYWVAVGGGATPQGAIQYSMDGFNWSGVTSGGFTNGGVGIGYGSNFPAYKQQGLTILSESIPLFWTSTNQILAQPSSLVVNATLLVDGQYNRVGINCNSPAYTLDVGGIGHFLTLSSLALNVSSLNGARYNDPTNVLSTVGGLGRIYVSTSGLTSTVAALGQTYTSTLSLLSTVGGLGQIYVSTSGLTSTVAALGLTYTSTLSLLSTTGGLGQIYVSTSGLTSTVAALGQTYTSTLSLLSTTGGLGQIYVSTSGLTSTVAALGQTYTSSLSLLSTVGGLGTSGYLSTQQLYSTGASYATSFTSIRLSTLQANMSSLGIGIQLPTVALDVGGVIRTSSISSLQGNFSSLGIGIVSPTVALDVVGTVRASTLSSLQLQTSTIFANVAYISTLGINTVANNTFRLDVAGAVRTSSISSLQGTFSTLGIGIQLPTVALDVAGTVRASTLSSLQLQTSTFFANVGYISTLGINTAANNTFRLDVAGAVRTSSISSLQGTFSTLGIGIQLPTVALDVVGTVRASTLSSLQGTMSSLGIGIQLPTVALDVVGTVRASTLSSLQLQTSTIFANVGYISTLGINTAANNTFRLDVAGAVRTSSISSLQGTFSTLGIGIQLPTVALDVVGTVRASTLSSLQLQTSTIFANVGYISTLGINTAANNTFRLDVAGAVRTSSISSLQGTFSTIGIGIQRPTVALDVVGTVRASSISSLVGNFSSLGIGLTNIGPGYTLDVQGVTNTSTIANVRIQPYSSNVLVALGTQASGTDNIKYSYDGLTWANASPGFSGFGWATAWNGEMWVAVGADSTANNTIKYSYNGINWTNSSGAGFRTSGRGIAWNGRLWVAVGDDTTSAPVNNIKYSSNGINWTNAATATSFSAIGYSVAWNGSMWVAVGQDATPNNTIKYSYDGITWSNSAGSGFTVSGRGVAWNGRIWVAIGDDASVNNKIKYSTDGINWINAPGASVTNEGLGVAWNGKMWVAVANDFSVPSNTIKYSYDGLNWTNSLSGGFNVGGRGIAWNGSFWIAAGSDSPTNNTIKYSVDGINWLNSGTAFTSVGNGVGYSSNLTPAYSQASLDILPQNIPLFLRSTNQIMAQTSSLLINNTLQIDSYVNRVGINTNNPLFTLDVLGTTRLGGLNAGQSVHGLQISSQRNQYTLTSMSGGNSFGYLWGAFNGWTPDGGDGMNLSYNFYNDDSAAKTGDRIVNTGGATSFIRLGYGRILFGTSTINAQPQTRMMIDSNGNIGISTTTPSYTLDVNGTGRVAGTFQSGVRLVTSTISASPTLATSDLNSYFLFTTTTGSLTINLPAAATAGNGWNVVIRNAPSSTQNFTVNSVTVAPGVTVTVVSDGSSLYNF